MKRPLNPRLVILLIPLLATAACGRTLRSTKQGVESNGYETESSTGTSSSSGSTSTSTTTTPTTSTSTTTSAGSTASSSTSTTSTASTTSSTTSCSTEYVDVGTAASLTAGSVTWLYQPQTNGCGSSRIVYYLNGAGPMEFSGSSTFGSLSVQPYVAAVNVCGPRCVYYIQNVFMLGTDGHVLQAAYDTRSGAWAIGDLTASYGYTMTDLAYAKVIYNSYGAAPTFGVVGHTDGTTSTYLYNPYIGWAFTTSSSSAMGMF